MAKPEMMIALHSYILLIGHSKTRRVRLKASYFIALWPKASARVTMLYCDSHERMRSRLRRVLPISALTLPISRHSFNATNNRRSCMAS